MFTTYVYYRSLLIVIYHQCFLIVHYFEESVGHIQLSPKAGYHRVGVHAEQAAPAHLSVGHGSTTTKTTPTHLTVDLLVKAKRIKMKLK